MLISHPKGFTLVDSSHAELRRIAEDLTPSSTRLLAYFARPSDITAKNQGKPASFNRYFLAQTARKLESHTVSAADFAQLRSMTKNQQSEILEKLEPRLAELTHKLEQRRSENTETVVSLRIGDVVPLGIYQDSESFVSFGAMSRVGYQEGASVEERTVLNVGSIVTVKGKVLFLHTYTTFKGSKDIEWAKQAAATWTNDVLALNR